MNMNKSPDSWVTVLDATSEKPVPEVPLVYMDIQKPYLIVGRLLVSREYITDEIGRAHVPSNVSLQPSPGSNWFKADDKYRMQDLPSDSDERVIYVRTREDHMLYLDKLKDSK